MDVENKSKNPLVSIIIPTYNRTAYLEAAIKSALSQTYPNFEIIISDDCSSDSPQDLVKSFNDSRIRFLQNTKNLGITLNIVNAFEAARGKYVASLNDDDVWTHEFLAKLIPHLESNPDLAVAFCDHYVIDSDGNINQLATEKSTKRWKRDKLKEGTYRPFHKLALVDQSVSCAVASVIRKEIVNWNELRIAGQKGMGRHWDYFLGYLICRAGGGAYYCPERLTKYRIHSQNVTVITNRKNNKTKINSGFSRMYCCEQFLADERLKDWWLYFRHKLAFGQTTMGIGLLRDGQRMKARYYLMQALRQKFSLRTLIALLLSFVPEQIVRYF